MLQSDAKLLSSLASVPGALVEVMDMHLATSSHIHNAHNPKQIANIRKQRSAVKVSKTSSTEQLPGDNAPQNLDPSLISWAGDRDTSSKKGFLRSFLPSTKGHKQSPPQKDLTTRKEQKRKSLIRSVPCSAIKTDNNDNILDPQGDHRLNKLNVSGAAKRRIDQQQQQGKILEEVLQEHGIKWQLPEQLELDIYQPPESENISAPERIAKASSKRSNTMHQKGVGQNPQNRNIEMPNLNPKGVSAVRKKKQRCTSASNLPKILNEDEKLTFEKATLILHEDEMVKEKLRNAVTELSKSCEKYRRDLQRNEERNAQEILKLQIENEALLLELSRANDSVSHWKSKYQRQENEVVNLSKLKIVTKENTSLKEDLEVLTSVVRRLNQEMAVYQEKLRSMNSNQDQTTQNQMPVFCTPSESPSGDDSAQPSNVQQQNYVIVEPKKTLLPLLTAYDEIIEEKNEIIKDHEVALEKFKVRCQEIVRENEDLHKVIGESSDTGSIKLEEWKFLHDNAVLVLEENELLHEQCKILRSKVETVNNEHEENVAKMRSRMSSLEEEAARLKITAKDTENQHSFLTTQISKMNTLIQQRVPIEQHDASIRECKRLFEELKTKYSEETNALKEKLAAVESEKLRYANELTGIDAENAKLLGRLRSLEKLQSSSNAQLKNVQTELSNVTKSKDVTAKAVNEIVELVETVIAEREALRASFYEQQALNEQLMNLRKKESQLVEELRGKIQLMENVHQEEMGKYRSHMTKLEEVLETVGERHQIDVMQLKELIKEKSAHIEKLGIEKEQLMEDLETVWRVTTRDANNSKGMPSPLLKKYNFLKQKQINN